MRRHLLRVSTGCSELQICEMDLQRSCRQPYLISNRNTNATTIPVKLAKTRIPPRTGLRFKARGEAWGRV